MADDTHLTDQIAETAAGPAGVSTSARRRHDLPVVRLRRTPKRHRSMKASTFIWPV